MSWHYIKETVLHFDTEKFREGNYLVYREDEFSRLLNDRSYQKENFDEYEFVYDHMVHMKESIDGSVVFIPDTETYLKIECHYLKLEMDE